MAAVRLLCGVYTIVANFGGLVRGAAQRLNWCPVLNQSPKLQDTRSWRNVEETTEMKVLHHLIGTLLRSHHYPELP